ncbi:hypothetical protein JCM10449v2_004282 [Rhodotorula kratochvilovae]
MVACRPLPGDATTAQPPSPPPPAYVRNGRTPPQPKETRRKVPYGTADWPGCRPAERRREAAQAKSPSPLFRSLVGPAAPRRPAYLSLPRCRRLPRDGLHPADAASAARPPFVRCAAPSPAQREDTPAQFVQPTARREAAWAIISPLEERARARKAEQGWQGWFDELEKRPERC